jgi:GxxExxY protein
MLAGSRKVSTVRADPKMNRILNIPAEVEETARQTVDAIFHIHRELGPGLLESVYATFLDVELRHRGLACVREVALPVFYREQRVDIGFRADCIVEGKLLLELKAVEALLPVHRAQVITYLKIARLPLGLLINFNVPLIKDGIHRLFSPALS